MKKAIIYVTGLMLVLGALLYRFDKIFNFKFDDGIQQVVSFYELEDNTVDVLVLGSSHAFVNILPEEIWHEKGITVYDLCASSAPVWNSYYYLVEALKTQKPKLVVYEAYTLTRGDDYGDMANIIKNTYGLKLSKNKLNALRTSVPDGNIAKYILEYSMYHNRYKSLSSEDFRAFNGDRTKYENWLGCCWLDYLEEAKKPEVTNDGTRMPLAEKQELYFRKIMELCKENDIELLVMTTPIPEYREDFAHIYNTVGDMTAEEGFTFVNFQDMTEEIGINWHTDYADTSHMTYYGSIRFAKFFADYIANEYDLASHDKSDKKYSTWNKSYLNFSRFVKDSKIKELSSINDYVSMLSDLDDSYIVAGYVNGNNEWLLTEEYWNLALLLVNGWNISLDGNVDDEPVVFVKDENGSANYQKNNYGYNWARRFGAKELIVSREGVFFDHENLTKTDNGINLVIFDKATQTVVDSIGINGEGIIR